MIFQIDFPNSYLVLTAVICIFNIFYVHWTQVFFLAKFAIIVWTRLFGSEDLSWVMMHRITVMHDRRFIVRIQSLASEESSNFRLIAKMIFFGIMTNRYTIFFLRQSYSIIVDLDIVISINPRMFMCEA